MGLAFGNGHHVEPARMRIIEVFISAITGTDP